MPNHHDARLLETFLTLVRFNTPSRQEKIASEWCADFLRPLGFDVVWDSAGDTLDGTVGYLLRLAEEGVAR